MKKLLLFLSLFISMTAFSQITTSDISGVIKNKIGKKIGHVKATIFKKQFDKVYDYWKEKAENEFNYFDELKFIKEHNLVFIYIILPPLEENEKIDPNNYFDSEN